MRIDLSPALQNIKALMHLSPLALKGSGSPMIQGISTDSRKVRPGDMFVALTGKTRNGSDFIRDAVARGAVGVLGDEKLAVPPGVWHLQAPLPVAVLTAWAGAWRRQSHAFGVAIGGSNGKTTVKEAVAAVLREEGSVSSNAGNYNSNIGFSLSMLSFSETDFWVSEIGISHPGEMLPMAQAAAPDLAVLTNVGHAHVGHFGSYEALCREKGKLAAGLAPGGSLLAPADLPDDIFPCAPTRILRAGKDIRLENIACDATGVSGDLIAPHRVITNLKWPIPGRVGVSLLTLAGGAGVLAGCGDGAIRRGLQKAGASTPRVHCRPRGDRLIVEDCYNASPESVAGALEMLSHLAQGRPRVAVLGDMLELGDFADALHQKVGREAVKRGIALLFTYGEKAREIAAGALAAGLSPTAIHAFGKGEEGELAAAICRLAPRDAVLLFKASAAMQMTGIIREMEKHDG